MTLAAVLAGTQAWHIETTDVLAGLQMLPDGCVQTVCTSPPYWGLRSYATAPVVMGGEPDCEHDWSISTDGRRGDGLTGGHGAASPIQATRQGEQFAPQAHGTCTRCAAWSGELGSEPNPGLFVAHLVAVLAAVKRVLRDDGTVWLNIGSSYTDKRLALIPERLAIALDADGWIIRSDIVWAKLAPMPESVRDRPTSAWEHVFLLSKRPVYFFDQDAIRMNGANCRNVWTIAPEPFPGAHFAVFPSELPRRCIKAGSRPGDLILDPFSGSGTTILVAHQLGRRAIGLELNADYAAMSRKRIEQDAPLVEAVATAAPWEQGELL